MFKHIRNKPKQETVHGIVRDAVRIEQVSFRGRAIRETIAHIQLSNI